MLLALLQDVCETAEQAHCVWCLTTTGGYYGIIWTMLADNLCLMLDKATRWAESIGPVDMQKLTVVETPNIHLYTYVL